MIQSLITFDIIHLLDIHIVSLFQRLNAYVSVDDESRSIPDALHTIQSKLQSLQGNQSEVLVNLSDLTKSVANLQSRLDMFNITKNKEGGEELIQQSVADLGVKVSEIKQMLEVTTNNSNTNTVSISMITTELNNLKVRQYIQVVILGQFILISMAYFILSQILFIMFIKPI